MSDNLLGVYSRAPLVVDRGEGTWLYDTDGNRWLDCVMGIATDALGHAHPKLVAALDTQAKKLWHVSNIFRIPGQEALAKRLIDATFADVVFFGNSGSEAIEGALKTARRYHHVNGSPERVDVIGFAGSFHGRTYAAVNASGNAAYLDGFGPRLPGYVQLTIDDEAGIAEAIARPTTAAVIVEPVQGEGGARALSGEWLKRVRDLCTQHGVLLIYDEVQSGMGRTGKLFAHQWFEGVEPDIMAIAKALGGGFPIGAFLATTEAAKGMVVGTHGSTFGGNPLAMAVGIAAFDEIAKEETLAHARAIAADFVERLTALKDKHGDLIVDVRGKGLLIGLKLVPNNREFMALARDHGILVAGGGENCVRLLPPLILSHDEVAEAVKRLDSAFADARTRLAKAA
ncbi:aspartate aminotransferase family protein [Sphingosinicella microcystinivorans]|uniref:aspartate aminotransferase family protein n=1 Tax=Sphingosinicella microcystinivorans TaxID=335406 RepID=UPI0022F3F230|nr:aspartate aminotransferase family protein [Sphingosinicella microcystinivorans]WBX83098.1 aspartate aminotransferase family protein [Sphingosinicella microcystinivorans]